MPHGKLAGISDDFCRSDRLPVMFALEDQIGVGSRLRRRQFLRVGGLSLGGLALPDFLALKSLAASKRRLLKDKSVIFLFMHGGPSQFETFDPKMTAPSGIRSVTGEIPTALPGVTFGSTFQKLARLADKFSVVRSFVAGDSDHNLKPLMGRDTGRATMGALYSRIAGPMRPDTAMPTNVALFPRSVRPEAGPAVTEFGNLASPGDLGAAHTPFTPGTGGGMQEDMKLRLPQARLNDRRSLLTALDDWRRWADAAQVAESFGTFQQQAFDALMRGVSESFDLSREDPRVIERYDTAGLVSEDRMNRKLNNHAMYRDHIMTLGRLMLLARRLCERGCGFVTVTTSFVWDMHADVNNAPMADGMEWIGTPFDHAVSAFIEDVEARGLRDKILLVCCGEMGRTPRVNAGGGRDHWGGLAPLLLYGGGLQMGQVIGQSSRDGSEPSSDPVTIPDLIATIMHTLLDLGEVRITDGIPRSVLEAIGAGTPIRGLV